MAAPRPKYLKRTRKKSNDGLNQPTEEGSQDLQEPAPASERKDAPAAGKSETKEELNVQRSGEEKEYLRSLLRVGKVNITKDDLYSEAGEYTVSFMMENKKRHQYVAIQPKKLNEFPPEEQKQFNNFFEYLNKNNIPSPTVKVLYRDQIVFDFSLNLSDEQRLFIQEAAKKTLTGFHTEHLHDYTVTDADRWKSELNKGPIEFKISKTEIQKLKDLCLAFEVKKDEGDLVEITVQRSDILRKLEQDRMAGMHFLAQVCCRALSEIKDLGTEDRFSLELLSTGTSNKVPVFYFGETDRSNNPDHKIFMEILKKSCPGVELKDLFETIKNEHGKDTGKRECKYDGLIMIANKFASGLVYGEAKSSGPGSSDTSKNPNIPAVIGFITNKISSISPGHPMLLDSKQLQAIKKCLDGSFTPSDLAVLGVSSGSGLFATKDKSQAPSESLTSGVDQPDEDQPDAEPKSKAP